MRSIKAFVIGVIVMIGFLGILALLLPSKVTVSKSILINAAESDVAKEIENFKNWKNWHPAFQNKNIIATIFQKGDSSFVTLTGEKQRKLTMTMIKPGPENIDIFLFAKDKNNITWQFILSVKSTGQTQLIWNVNTIFPWYPWKKIAGIFLDKVTGSQYQEILQNLKKTVELHQEGSPG